jgi:predicted ATPase/transcriptional regulator with XRE-family HTH domain
MDQEFSFGEWIRKRRNTLGLTQEAVAEQVGYSTAMIRKIEDGERRPSARAAVLLAEALEIPADQRDMFLKVARQERAVDQLGSLEEREPFPWQAASRSPSNLPVPTTLLVGREADVIRLTNLLQDPAHRLIVLVGLAGIGKTRLALQVAHTQVDRFRHGVFFVSLAPLTSPDRIVTCIGTAIGFHFGEGADPQQQLIRYLREKEMLIVLDSLEHLVAGAGLLSKILRAAPGIVFLVTSRERLNLQGEWVFEVEGLAYPSSRQESGVEEYEAVQLFLQNALRVHPAFQLNKETRKWVVRICQLTEGMPLGIELAAAWVRVLSCQQIAREIERNLDFLKTSARDLPRRHWSLRAALDHSWNLLSPEEKRIFQRVSVFRGGFSREAVLEVAGASLEELTSLLDKSLLRRVGEERYDLHELVRQYAASHLASDPEEDAWTHARHSSFYAAQLERWGEKIASPQQMETLAEMDAEIENVRLAWSWMIAQPQAPIAEMAKSLRSLWRFFDIRGQFQEGAALMGQATTMMKTLEAGKATGNRELAIVLARARSQEAYFYVWLGRYVEAHEMLQQSLVFLRASQDRSALAFTLTILGYMKTRMGEYEEARNYIEESLALNRALGDRDTLVYGLVTLSYIYIAQGEYQNAYALSREALGISRDQLGDPLATEHCLLSLSAAASRLNQDEEARRWAQESLEIS